MSLELTVTAKGQVTLRKAVLRHLGIEPGGKIEIVLLDGGRVELAPRRIRDFSRLRGALKRPGQPVVTIQQMRDAVGYRQTRVKIAIDTNVLVRYLTWDDEVQATEAAAAIEAADEVHISTIVLCETIWVLTRAYRYKMNEIMPLIDQIVTGREFDIDQVAARTGLRLLVAGGDFVDGVIFDDMHRASCEFLATFDREFARLAESSKIVLLGV